MSNTEAEKRMARIWKPNQLNKGKSKSLLSEISETVKRFYDYCFY